MKSQMLKNQLNKDKLHHAYLLESAKENILEELNDFLESELKFPTKGNPDFWLGEYDTFGIDESRKIKEAQSRRALGERKIFVIITNFFTREAQNALLKVFEEPTEKTHFFIITPNTESLLPTLRSRLFELSSPRYALGFQGRTLDKGLSFAGGLAVEAVEFLESSKAKRLEMLKKIIESKNKQKAIDFLNSLETVLYKKVGHRMSDQVSAQEVFVFEEIIKARSYLNDRSPSIKMILEHIALITT